MLRGTTPTILFRFLVDVSDYDEIQLTFSQGGKIVSVFGKDDMEYYTTEDATETTYYIAQLTLTQEQVNLFDTTHICEVQFRFRDGDSVAATGIKKVDINRVLNDEVLE